MIFYLHNIRMSENDITFMDRKINKSNFYRTILIYKKGTLWEKGSFKYFIAYDDNVHVGPLN